MDTLDQAGESAPSPGYATEIARVNRRRARLQIPRSESWALALSGGGIRSATFCLGVLQGLAKSPPPSPGGNAPAAPKSARESLLPQFDFLSTVSGGGYIGSFFCSLFVSGRLNTSDTLTEEQTAGQAYRVFEEEPPGRLRGNVRFEADAPGRAPLAWLRENGRYMAPTGAGDMVYALSLAIRNWFAMHYVLGTILLTAFAFLGLARAALVDWSFGCVFLAPYRLHESSLLDNALSAQHFIWWSPVWWLALPVLLLWLIPCGLAFWLTHPNRGGGVSDPPTLFSLAACCDLLIGVALCASATVAWQAFDPAWHRVVAMTGLAGILTILGLVWHAASLRGAATISAQRVALTRALARGLTWLAAVVLLAVVDTAAQSLYLGQSSLTPALATGALVWLVRHLASAFSEKERSGWLSKIPLGLIVAVAGIALLVLVAIFWSMLAHWIQWRGHPPQVALFESMNARSGIVWLMFATAVLALLLAFVSGQFPGFLNLSTLQGLYSARLTRAYLGASNGERFAVGNEHLRSAAEPVASDQISAQTYYAQNPLAPTHIINVCVNQTIDPAEQLVQRDRKGKPLAIVPDGFALDGVFSSFPATGARSEVDAQLSIGEWVGVSGAAFSTGMGRGTTLGYSLLMGLVNLRLGRWWRSGMHGNPGPGSKARTGGLLRRAFKTQSYLLDELFATYYGTRRPLQYLSDGGHFENTAVYELLRGERAIRLIVVCDCGCDPNYEFEDLANLVRLARIDFGIEIEADPMQGADDAVLKTVFGTPEDFSSNGNTRCALLLNVYRTKAGREAGTPDARIVVLKPRLVEGAALDLVQYRGVHAAFPQEPTADQFYDEAQWESYRRLGLEISTRVFGVKDDGGAYSKALWARLSG